MGSKAHKYDKRDGQVNSKKPTDRIFPAPGPPSPERERDYESKGEKQEEDQN